MPNPPLPPFQPQRQQISFDQQGNPFWSAPNMAHPASNRAGLNPSAAPPYGPLAWSTVDGQQFRSNGTNQVWRWESALFDLRPGVSAAYGMIAQAVPVNHEAALGQSIQLSVLISSRNGQTPPANIIGMTASYAELGNNLTTETTLSLCRFTSITDLVQAGGTSLVTPFGASVLSFTPLSAGLRFWKVVILLTIPGTTPITNSLYIQAMIH